MKQSKLFTKTTKNISKDETSYNAQALIKAGFIDKLFAGVYTILPLGLIVIRKIENIIREEINEVGGQEILMPALHPIENYLKTGRENIDILFRTEMHNGAKLVLGQSHEEIVVPLVQKHVFSYKDLPAKPYQFQTKFRNELRAKSGIMRGREFIMKDLYSFHANQTDLDSFYKEATQAYRNIFKRFGLDDITYFTYASGGTFSKYSHEFQTLTESGEDDIYICDKCKIAINEEIIKDLEHKCPECGGNELHKEKAVEVANIFKLKSKFTTPFNFKYVNKEGKEQDLVMGCYGIGLTRAMGTIVETNHDDKGIIWPKEITPFQTHLVVLGKDEEVIKKAEELYIKLKQENITVLFDERENASVGSKLSDSDLLGIPVRLIISKKTEDNVEFKFRNEKESNIINTDKVISNIKEFYNS